MKKLFAILAFLMCADYTQAQIARSLDQMTDKTDSLDLFRLWT